MAKENIEADLLYKDISKLPRVSWNDLISSERSRIKNFIKSETSCLEKTIGPSSMKYIPGYAYNTVVFYRD